MTKKLLFCSFLLLGAFSLYQSKNSTATSVTKKAFTIPINVVVSNISTTSATVMWDPIAGSTSFAVRFRPVGPNLWSSISVFNTNGYTFTDLQPCTAYEVQIIDVASGDISTSVIFYTSLNYCISASTDSNIMHISNVTVTSTGVTNPMISNSGPSNYTDYRTDPGRRVKFFAGSPANKLSVTNTWTGTAGPITVNAWIDINGNGVFEAVEKVMNANVSSAIPVVSTFPIPGYPTIPSALIGGCGVTMRVISSQTFPTGACGTFTYGEVEDYGVDFLDPFLAVKEPGQSAKPEIYPNPASDILNVSGISEAADFEIYNAVGQKAGEGKTSDHKVKLQRLPQGVYFIQLKDNENITRFKFIKK
ncbi:GEVED domain-containing protein [Chryseobacterium sp.]|uniref:GEVED domain-containing protein n=1 Tax=Chryseobacterium sp. TaxID=1871047 RepID=UPI002635BEC2|nr:GEVED domain-containing protein [Chryseobacterium sp.]